MYTTLQGTFGGLTAPLGERKNGKDDSLNRDGNRERARTRIHVQTGLSALGRLVVSNNRDNGIVAT